MYIYTLPNGLPINSERLVEFILEGVGGEDFPQLYIDTVTGATIEIPAKENLLVWVKEIGASDRYFSLEGFTTDELIDLAKEFLEEEVLERIPKLHLTNLKKCLQNGVIEDFENELISLLPELYYEWQDYLEYEATNLVHSFFTNNPKIKVKAEFVGCEDGCPFCRTMEQIGETDDTEKILRLLQTELVMESVENQLKQQTSLAKKVTPKVSKPKKKK